MKQAQRDMQRARIEDMCRELVDHLAHVLPAQAPIRDFVHHNTLHGLQHLPFEAALATAHRHLGAKVYWTEKRFRQEMANGRITREDLAFALSEAGEGVEAENAAGISLPGCSRHEILLASLIALPEAPTTAALDWQLQEDEHASPLWPLCLTAAEKLAATGETTGTAPPPASYAGMLGDTHWQQAAARIWDTLAARVGHDWTLRSLLEHLTGEDVLDAVREDLQAHLAAHLDMGMAAWHNPARPQGFYRAWKQSAGLDLAWDIDALAHLREEILSLPDAAAEALAEMLPRLVDDESTWPMYLERLCLELPGWSGMFLQQARLSQGSVPHDLIDYLAVRVALECLMVERLLNQLVGAPLSLAELGAYYAFRPGELTVRDALRRGDLPEDLTHAGQALLEAEDPPPARWDELARKIARWRATPASPRLTAMRLAAVMAELGLSADTLSTWSDEHWSQLWATATELPPLRRGHLWLLAYEHHYRQHIFTGLMANQGRGTPPETPSAQVVMCMDDREEGTRRHLEEIAPAIQTYGAAGFLGLPMLWQGLDDAQPIALCPVVMRPTHLIRETSPDNAALARHHGRRTQRLQWREKLVQSTRLKAASGSLLSLLCGPISLGLLGLNALRPAALGEKLARWRKTFDGPVSSQLELTAAPGSPAASPDAPRAGFDDAEQAQLVASFLRTIGLTEGFAPLVLMLGHGSESRNNPHRSAYDCGACSGRHGGPNARVFAAMANRPEVRIRLAAEGILIPEHTLFVSAQHNTCDDSVHWYDTDAIPTSHQGIWQTLAEQLDTACASHAVERCRRLASAPAQPNAQVAFRHVADRLHDLSQARPELGHATNATAIVGRRDLSRKLFLDRRAFLISYDPSRDADGSIVEQLLLSVAPVGAGISLEYYFSSVDNDYFGCASKITHNLTGLFGVMEGTHSDLRTGLPRQMVEIHEPMRLLVIIEQTPDMLTGIVGRQPRLAELIANEWIVVAAKTPDQPRLHRFCPRRGWLLWDAPNQAGVGQAACSHDWFNGQSEALPPALLGELGGPTHAGEAHHV